MQNRYNDLKGKPGVSQVSLSSWKKIIEDLFAYFDASNDLLLKSRESKFYLQVTNNDFVSGDLQYINHGLQKEIDRLKSVLFAHGWTESLIGQLTKEDYKEMARIESIQKARETWPELY
ncbi:MAG TPA: hypothetical protein PKH94_07410 [Bacteroidales bacterium]|nr:hypothetical protein [Bacteroidales bacterium]HNS47050.1 hypothetical protein [Bacteroidales bacterium]